MELTDINILLSIVTGVVGIYVGYRKALIHAQQNGRNDDKIIIMIENLTKYKEKKDKKLDNSIKEIY